MMIEQTKEECKKFERNSKGLYYIVRDMLLDEYRRIQSCTTSKQAWNILETTHEGTTIVKRSKILKTNILS